MPSTVSIRRVMRKATALNSTRALGLLGALIFAAPAAAQPVPVISSLSPVSATRSGYVEALGSGFGASGRLLVDGLPSLTVTWTDTRVVAYVAEAARLGTVPVQVLNDGGASNTVNLTVTARAQQGRVRWRLRMDSMYSSVRPAVGPDGTIYPIDVDGRLYAVAPDGALLWVAPAAGSKGVAVGGDGTIYTGDENWIKAFHPDGRLKWTFVQNPRAFILIDVAVGPDGNIYGVATQGMGVFSLTPAGSLRWATPELYQRRIVSYAEIHFGPGPDGRPQLYFSANNHTRAIRLEDGAEIFLLALTGSLDVSPLDGTLHYSSSAFRSDGALYWQFPDSLGGAPSLGPDGVHYATGSMLTYRLHAINPGGTERWHVALDDSPGAADVDPTNRHVVVAGFDTLDHPGVVLAHETAGGAQSWRVELPAEEPTVYNPWTAKYGFNQYVDSRAEFSALGDTVYLMTAIATGGLVTDRAFLYAFDVNGVLPPSSTLLRSTDIQLTARARRSKVVVHGTVWVQDENRNPISGATVSVTWTLPDGSTSGKTASTDAAGQAIFKVSNVGGSYTLSVRNISKAGYAFDSNNSVMSKTYWFSSQ
jgi:hypothetical protein